MIKAMRYAIRDKAFGATALKEFFIANLGTGNVFCVVAVKEQS